MRVEHYIEHLLYRYECVIVPGLGAFVTQKSTTEYHPNTDQFTPPTKRITFNKAIQNQDGLLAETIAKAESMDFESAKLKIQLFVEDFHAAITTDKVIDIPSLGRFCLGNEGKLSFEPNDYINYFIESFGLQEVKLKKIEETLAESTTPKVVSKVKDLYPVSSVGVSNSKPSDEVFEDKEERVPRPYLKYAAVGLIAFSLAGFGGLYQYSNRIAAHNDKEAQKAESLLQDQIQKADFNYTFSELPLSTKKKEVLLPKYHIVAGAFRVESNAEKKVRLLKAKGYDASLIGTNAYGLHQVTFGSYTDRSEALAQLRKIKANESPEAWLYVKQL